MKNEHTSHQIISSGSELQTTPDARFVDISPEQRKGKKHWAITGKSLTGKTLFSMDVNLENKTYKYVDEKTGKLFSNDPSIKHLRNYAGELPAKDLEQLQKMTRRAGRQTTSEKTPRAAENPAFRKHSFGISDDKKLQTTPNTRFVDITPEQRKGEKHWAITGKSLTGKTLFSMDVNLENKTYKYVDEKTGKLFSNDPSIRHLKNYAGELPAKDLEQLRKLTDNVARQISPQTQNKQKLIDELRNGNNSKLTPKQQSQPKPEPTQQKRKSLFEIYHEQIFGRGL